MLRVYLDQNKWVDLARARVGHPQGAAFVEAYQECESMVAADNVSFPLSSAHYFETYKRSDAKSRSELAETMVMLSNLAAIAPPHVIVPWEIRRGLVETLRLPIEPPRSPQLFGTGANHIFATDTLTYRAPTEVNGHSLPGTIHQQITMLGQAITELALLGHSCYFGEMHFEILQEMRKRDAAFVDGQNRVRDKLAEVGRGHLTEAMIGTGIGDILDPMQEAANEFGLELGSILEQGLPLLEPLLRAMPSRWVEAELRGARQSNPQKKWEGNDLNDVTALAIAVPYCDVVVTERAWSGMINTRKINRGFATHVLHDLRKLPELLQEKVGRATVSGVHV